MNEDVAVWFLSGDDNQPKGPYCTADILTALRQGQLRTDGLCWREGMPGWQSMAEVAPFSTASGQAAVGEGAQGTAHAVSPNLGRAVSKMVGLTRKTAKTVSLKMAISSHEKHRQQLLCEFGEMLYKRESEVALLLQSPYAEKLGQIKQEDLAIDSLRRQIEDTEKTRGASARTDLGG
jgi:hypothetical protein